MRFVSAVLAAFLGFALVGGPAVQAAPDAQAAPKVSRAEMLKRAATWLTANGGKQVPYSMEKVWKDGYRQDCSGYVSMSAKLDKSGPNTVALATSKYTTPINKADMKPGDLFIDPVDEPGSDFRHVVIFEKWANAQKSAYVAYEQRGGHGTDHRTLKYGLNDSKYKAYRLKNIVD